MNKDCVSKRRVKNKTYVSRHTALLSRICMITNTLYSSEMKFNVVRISDTDNLK